MDIRPQLLEPLKRMCLVGDITDQADVANALEGVRAVVHCAAQVSVERSTQDPVSDARTNVLGTVNMLNESARAGVSRFVYVSSAAVYGQPKYIPIDEGHPTSPISNYGSSKLAGEKYALSFALNSRMETVVVRPFNFYSPRADPQSPYSGVMTKFVSRALEGKAPIIEGDGRQTRDFVHARDVAEMIVLAMEKKGLTGEVFNCGSGVSTSVSELAAEVIKASGKNLVPEHAPARMGDIRESLASCAKARGLLGYRPKVTLSEGIAELMR
jgi:UDP-glucose 4-epimerase